MELQTRRQQAMIEDAEKKYAEEQEKLQQEQAGQSAEAENIVDSPDTNTLPPGGIVKQSTQEVVSVDQQSVKDMSGTDMLFKVGSQIQQAQTELNSAASMNASVQSQQQKT